MPLLNLSKQCLPQALWSPSPCRTCGKGECATATTVPRTCTTPCLWSCSSWLRKGTGCRPICRWFAVFLLLLYYKYRCAVFNWNWNYCTGRERSVAVFYCDSAGAVTQTPFPRIAWKFREYSDFFKHFCHHVTYSIGYRNIVHKHNNLFVNIK